MKFSGCQLNISASISGQKDKNAEFVPQLVTYVMENGADVLDEHIRGKDLQEMVAIVKRRTGVDRLAYREPWKIVYQQDMEWVDQASHMIIFVDRPSHGVGMELMRGLLKPSLGLNPTPILILLHEENVHSLSPVVRGIPQNDSQVQLKTYQDFADIQREVDSFLVQTDEGYL